MVLKPDDLQLSRGESIRDTALVLSRYVQAVGIRTGAHEVVEELAAHSAVPVVNMLSRDHHPCQALADLLTLRERFGDLEGLKLAYVGDGNNVARSPLVLGGLAGVEVTLATPPELSLPDAVSVPPEEAAAGAHALYTDVWVSMGDEEEAERRRGCSRRTAWTRRCSPTPGPTRWSSTACPPIRARRSARSPLRRSLRRLGPGGEPAHAQKALLELLLR